METALPGPRRITFVTNPDECNLACRMCREHSPLRGGAPGRATPRRLSPALVERVLAERAGSPLAEVIPSTKGEPLLWPGLDALVDLCARRGLSLNVTTNGTFPGRGPEAWAERLAPVASDVKISWNGASPATFESVMGGLRHHAAVDRRRRFVRARDARRASGERAFRVSLQVTAQAANVAELPAMVRFAAEAGVERVKVNHLQVHFPELAGCDLRGSRTSRSRWNEAVAEARAMAERTPLAASARVVLQNFLPLPLEGGDPPYGPCPFLGREAWVGADGRFVPCPAPAGFEGRLGEFGSLAEVTMGEIWASAPYRDLVTGYRERTECGHCPMRRPGGL